MPRPRIPLLAFCGPTSFAFDRQIAVGIFEYLLETGRGRLMNAEGDAPGLTLGVILSRTPEVDGIVLHGSDHGELAARGRVAPPIVSVSSSAGAPRFASAMSDDVAVGRLGADYFLSRGYRNFGYAGFPGHAYSMLRWEGFRGRIEEAGATAVAIHAGPESAGGETWSRMPEATGAWLRTLPLPCAVLGCNDGRARMVAVAAHRLGLRIPEDIAILGVDNDEFTCELSPVPLSSIEPDCRGIGRAATKLLLDLISGRRSQPAQPPPVLRIAPLRVVERRSTDALAVSDDQVARALRFIHTHALEPIGVEDIAKAAGFARRRLEREFRAHTGASPYAEILRLRIEHSKELLTTSRLKIAEIADQCGFATASEFSVAFRRRARISPIQYRKSTRPAR